MKDDKGNDDNIIKLGSTPDSEKKVFSGNGPDEEQLLEKASEELDEIKDKFLQFQADIEGYALTSHMIPAIEYFAIFASSVSTIIEEDLPEGKTKEDKQKRKELLKLRESVLKSIKNKYY
jgi:hypothetical protein